MNLTDLEIGLILVEGSLLISFGIILLYVRRRMNPAFSRRMRKGTPRSSTTPRNWDHLQTLLKEADSLSQNLSRNIEEKKEIAKRLLDALDSRMDRLQKNVNGFSQGKPPLLERRENPDPVFMMAADGWAVADMSRRLGRSREEIQLILDLQKCVSEPSKG